MPLPLARSQSRGVRHTGNFVLGERRGCEHLLLAQGPSSVEPGGNASVLRCPRHHVASSALSICDEEQEAADALSAVPVVVLELEAELVKEDVSGPHCIKSLRGKPAQVRPFTSRGRSAVGVKGASRASWGEVRSVILTPSSPQTRSSNRAKASMNAASAPLALSIMRAMRVSPGS